MKPVMLFCEYQKNPLNINVEKPRFGWNYNSEIGKQKAYSIQVKNEQGSIIWDSGRIESAKMTHVEYEGLPLDSFQRYDWFVSVWNEQDQLAESEPNFFYTGCFDKNQWSAKWISIDAKRPTYFRKSFTVHQKPKQAIAYVSALGVFELSINGNKVSNDILAPGWTDYEKRIQYMTYDIASYINEGQNEITAVVGEGWFAGNIAMAGKHQYGDYPLRFFMQVEGDFSLTTDESWQGAIGAITYTDLIMGETIDGRITAMNWQSVQCEMQFTQRLVAHIGESIQRTEELKPIAVYQYEDKHIFDMGQNMVGYARFRMQGESGQKIVLRFGEMLNDDGSLYTENLRSAKQTDTFILSGQGIEEYEPKFTFHGFRYVELSGAKDTNKDTITGVVIHNNLGRTGSFSCSDDMVNRLWLNANWGQRGNFVSIPTDCPQRDERLGWTGDAQVFCKTACYNMGAAMFYEKYLQDMLDAQREDGAFTNIAPTTKTDKVDWMRNAGNSAWAEAGIIIPWTLYSMYGDRRVLEHCFDGMANYITFLKENSENLIYHGGEYGDWLNIDADTPKPLIGTAYFAYACELMDKICIIIDKPNPYKELTSQIKKAFVKKFVDEDGKMPNDTQTSYLLALKFHLVPEVLVSKIVHHLVEAIKARNYHLSTGFVGVSYLLPVLSDYGYTEIAYRLLLNKTYPSWGYSVVNGATTIWERWNSYTKENGFGDVGMNSFNHYSYGSVAEWMYGYAAGIKITDEAQFEIKPEISTMDFVKASYQSIYGKVAVHWTKQQLTVETPANTFATVILPNGSKIEMNGGKKTFSL